MSRVYKSMLFSLSLFHFVLVLLHYQTDIDVLTYEHLYKYQQEFSILSDRSENAIHSKYILFRTQQT